MKEQITTWLFLLLLGSGYNIESVQGQNIINEFPYELSPESYSKWTLEEGYDWIVTSSMGKPVYGFGGGESYTYAISPLFDFSSLNQPEITFTGGYFTFETLDEQGNILFSSFCDEEEKTVTFNLNEECRQFRFTKTPRGVVSVKDLIVGEAGTTDISPISQFPYTLEPQARGWKLTKGEWGSIAPIISGSRIDLLSPKITLPEKGGSLLITGKSGHLNIYGSIDGETYDLLNSTNTESTSNTPLSKDIHYLRINNIVPSVKIGALTINGFSNDLNWTVSDDTYTLSGEECEAGQTAFCWLPEVSLAISKNGSKGMASFKIASSSMENIELYFIDKNNINKEIPITTVNGIATVDLGTLPTGTYKMIPGFKAVVNKKGKTPTVVISKFFAGTTNNAMQFDLNYWYDEDRDGQMEFCFGQEEYGNYWKSFGKYKLINGRAQKYEDFPENISSLMPCNINNDKTIDYCGGILRGNDENHSFDYKVYTNNEQGENKDSQIFESWGTSRITGKSGEIFVPCDYNNDGLTDFLLPHSKVAVQLIDGSFEIHQLEILTQDEYLNRDKTNDEWSQNGNYSGVVVQDRNDAFLSGKDMFIGGKGEYTGSMGYQTSNIDFNKDGYPDIVNTGTGEILLYVAKDKYVGLPMGGAIYFRDLNNDQRLDYIVYEPASKTVTAHVYQSDGTEKTQQLISNLSMDQQVWCYDFDKDGDIDILLPFSYLDSNGAAYLVIMENDGKGKFKMHETAFDEELAFKACADIDHDGYYDIVAQYAPKKYSDVVNDVLLLKGNNRMQFELQPTPLIHLTESKNNYRIQAADIDNDGYYDIMSQYYNDQGKETSMVYSVKDLLPDITANQAPQKPEKPSYLFEPSTGFLKISWQPGKDTESSSVDLTYALRIGTKPGKGDIYYAHATENGMRLNLLDGNMGYNLDRILDASGWNAGKYYIAIQTIDPMHNGSMWSEETIFEKSQSGSGFRLSDERTVCDTITLALLAPKDLSLEYKWDMAGATVISESNNSSVYQIRFTTPGEKRISLQTVDTQGNVTAVTDQTIFIFANRLVMEKLSTSPSRTDIYGTIDMDNDGTPELLTYNGVHENDGKGNYTKVKKIYNTNLSFNDKSYITDLNRDGLADIVIRYYSKNDGTKPTNRHYINQGDKTLSEEIYDASSFTNVWYDLKAVDFTHDGYMDFFSDDGDLFMNSGNDIDFTTSFDAINSSYNITADFNKDGFYDFIGKSYLGNNEYEYVIHFNNGDGSFRRCPIIVPEEIIEDRIIISAVADMNNDGYPDLLIQKNDNTILILLNNKNEDFKEVKEITLPMDLDGLEIGKIFDFDNNGYLDLSLLSRYNGSILYFYDDLQTKFINYGDNRSDYNGIGIDGSDKYIEIDVDRDGVPDFVESNQWASDQYYKNLSTVSNTRPEAPSNIRGTQTEDFAVIKWDAAKDAETPYTLMRYNISVKKQGQTGEGAYIISPMNDLNADAAVITDFIYTNATTYSIPLSAMSTGTYEIQVQAIDGWNATSPFSEPYLLTVESNPQMRLPLSVCAGTSAIVAYTGNASASGITWDWGGGKQIFYTDYGKEIQYEVVWDTEGKKQISATSDGVTSTAEIWVAPAINPEFSIPSQALLVAETPMTLPEGDYEYSWEVSKDGSDFKALGEYRVPPVRIVRNGNSNQAKATFMSTGNFVLRLSVSTPCGIATCDKSITVADELSRQEINLITVDPATGKYSISWQYPTAIPAFVSNVNIYKEGSKYNDFYLLATVPVSQTSFVDMTSNPQVQASRYRLTLQTNYGAETTPGTPHQGVHAMINKGAGNGWNVTWSQYEGATIETYRILRGTTSNNLTVIAEISGNNTSYSDLNVPAGILYYALDFDAKYEDNWKPMQTGRQSRAGKATVRSNIVSTDGAANVIFAEDIIVHSTEEPTLSPEQTSIHLTADIYPLNATFRAVNWTIVSGNNIATVNQNGILTAKGDKNGSITVRASAIDGSNVYKEITVTADGLTSINELEKEDNTLIYPSPVTDMLYIKNMPEGNGNKNKIYIVSLNGQLLYMEETASSEANISCSNYSTGIYLLKIVSEDKVTTRRFIKK